MMTLRIGTRGSQLALWQAHWVAEELLTSFPYLDVQVVVIRTSGDESSGETGGQTEDSAHTPLNSSQQDLDSVGLFTSEIERALLDGKIDLAVHSLKDLPCELGAGLEIGAYCRREDSRDVLISKNELSLDELPAGSQIGTSSLRRRAQILAFRPDLRCVELRGNLDTRLRKLDESPDLSGIVVAAAGMIRLGWQSRISQYLDRDRFLPAPAQGVIAVEISTERSDVKDLMVGLNHKPTELEARTERSFLQALQAGCHTPVGAHAVLVNGSLELSGMVFSLDGYRHMEVKAKGTDPELIGQQAAKDALRAGEVI